MATNDLGISLCARLYTQTETVYDLVYLFREKTSEILLRDRHPSTDPGGELLVHFTKRLAGSFDGSTTCSTTAVSVAYSKRTTCLRTYWIEKNEMTFLC